MTEKNELKTTILIITLKSPLCINSQCVHTIWYPDSVTLQVLHSCFPFVSTVKIVILGTSLVVQWLRLQAPNTRGPDLIPGQGTRSHILQPKIWYSKINKQK